MAKKPPRKTHKVEQSPDDLQVTFQGAPTAVRKAISEATFVAAWTRAVARRIAREETGVANAALDDTLGGPKLRMEAEEVRLDYRDRCCDRAAELGHPVDDEDAVTSGADNTVREVGDSLYDAARR